MKKVLQGVLTVFILLWFVFGPFLLGKVCILNKEMPQPTLFVWVWGVIVMAMLLIAVYVASVLVPLIVMLCWDVAGMVLDWI